MAFLRKLIAVIGRGPTALATAGVVGASVSAPHVVDSVGPGCLGNMSGVGDAWVHRSQWTKIAKGKKENVSMAPEWEGLGGIEFDNIGKKQEAFPCYSFLTTYGGATSTESGDTNEGNKMGVNVVKRRCSNQLWKSVNKAVSDGWSEFKEEVTKLAGSAKSVDIGEEGKKKVEQIIEKLTTATQRRAEGSLWGLMKEIRILASDFWAKTGNHEWWLKNVFEKGGSGNYGMEQKRWPDWFEWGAKKIINLEEKFKVEGDKLKQGLSKTPTFCAST